MTFGSTSLPLDNGPSGCLPVENLCLEVPMVLPSTMGSFGYLPDTMEMRD